MAFAYPQPFLLSY